MANELMVKKGGDKPAPYSQEQIELIKRTVAKDATNDELKLFLIVAARSGLDPFSRQIHFVKRNGQGTFQTGIDGYRAIAERSRSLAGIDDPIYDAEDGAHPNKASVTVYRLIDGIKSSFTASARWNEYVPGPKQDFMWRKMPYLMLGKVAEALALRKAFPNDLSGLYTHEEMAQADNEPTTTQAVTVESRPAKPLPPKQQTVPESQLKMITRIAKEKGYTRDDVVAKCAELGFDTLTGGPGGSASKVIDWLLKAPSRIVDVPEGAPALDSEIQRIAEGIDY